MTELIVLLLILGGAVALIAWKIARALRGDGCACHGCPGHLKLREEPHSAESPCCRGKDACDD